MACSHRSVIIQNREVEGSPPDVMAPAMYRLNERLVPLTGDLWHVGSISTCKLEHALATEAF